MTPFRAGGIDETALQDLVEWQIAEGSHGLVPCGTTGESATLSHEEHRRVVALVIEAAAHRVPVIAGTGSNSTAEAIQLSRHAEQAGADALLVVVPYYNRPSQDGIYLHFRHLDARVGIPIIVYDIPVRSAVEVSIDTLKRIHEDCANVAGVKDATADLARPSLTRIACGERFNLLSGEDPTAMAYMAHGGHGCISVTANVAPRLCAELQTRCMAGDYAAALALQDRLMPLHRALFLEPDPAGPKWALERLGRIAGEIRLPLLPVGAGVASRIEAAMESAGLFGPAREED